jgi:hypothetical protein
MFLVLFYIIAVALVFGLVLLMKASLITGEVTFGGDMWPELSVAVVRSKSPRGFWLALAGLYGLLLALALSVVAYLVYHDFIGTMT